MKMGVLGQLFRPNSKNSNTKATQPSRNLPKPSIFASYCLLLPKEQKQNTFLAKQMPRSLTGRVSDRKRGIFEMSLRNI